MHAYDDELDYNPVPRRPRQRTVDDTDDETVTLVVDEEGYPVGLDNDDYDYDDDDIDEIRRDNFGDMAGDFNRIVNQYNEYFKHEGLLVVENDDDTIDDERDTEEGYVPVNLTDFLPVLRLYNNNNTTTTTNTNNNNKNNNNNNNDKNNNSKSTLSAEPKDWDAAIMMEEKLANLKDCPASRFIKDPQNGPGVLFPIDKEINRKTLQERIATEMKGFPTENLHVGYIDKEAVGLALATVPAGELRDRLLEAMPGARLADPLCDDDVLPFMKPRKSGGSKNFTTEEGDEESKPHSAPVIPREAQLRRAAERCARRQLLDGLKSVERLEELIRERGGLGNVRFLCLDCEAAVVNKHASIPLEIAISRVDPLSSVAEKYNAFHTIKRLTRDILHQRREEAALLHMFVHPGQIEDHYTAMLLSVCECSGMGHGIPFSHWNKLRYDYSNMAKEIKALLNDPQTIVVTKGPSLNDLNAIRWVYMAAAIEEDEAIGYGSEKEAKRLLEEHPDLTLSAALAMPFTDLSTVQSYVLKSLGWVAPKPEGDNADHKDAQYRKVVTSRDEFHDMRGHGFCDYHRRIETELRVGLEDDEKEKELHCALDDAIALKDAVERALRNLH